MSCWCIPLGGYRSPWSFYSLREWFLRSVVPIFLFPTFVPFQICLAAVISVTRQNQSAGNNGGLIQSHTIAKWCACCVATQERGSERERLLSSANVKYMSLLFTLSFEGKDSIRCHYLIFSIPRFNSYDVNCVLVLQIVLGLQILKKYVLDANFIFFQKLIFC